MYKTLFNMEMAMTKSDAVKERIIESAISLINEGKGDMAGVSTRAIAERANTGPALINYHFQTKERLIEICVERIIGDVIFSFSPELPKTAQTPVERLKYKAKMVMDFLIKNPAVSRLSMLGDFNNPKKTDNTMKSSLDCSKTLDGLAAPEKERLVLSFALTSVMQTLFLRKDLGKELFGYDIHIKKQRDELIDLLVGNLFGTYKSGKENKQ